MDNLRNIIHTLSEDDSKEFISFINRLKQKTERKDLELYTLLRTQTELKPSIVVRRLYKTANTEAYHALRKRLLAHLIDFILLKNTKITGSKKARILGNYGLARYLFEHDNPILALSYLKKAEAMAKAGEQHEALNAIYNLMIQESERIEGFDLDGYILIQQANKKLADEDERAVIAMRIVKARLNTLKLHAADVDIEALVEQTLRKYDLHTAFASRPRLWHDLIVITRSAFVAKKDFFAFEAFVIQQYDQIKESGGFKPKDLDLDLNIQYIAAHTLYRNKRFDQALKYLNSMESKLDGASHNIRNQFQPRWIQLKAATMVFQNKLEDAITLLHGSLNDNTLKLKPEVQLNTIVNLGVYYFHAGQLQKANQTLMSIEHTDNWCEKHTGPEWVMKKNIMEVILFAEMEKEELAISRIRLLERKYGSLFKNPLYKRVKVYLSLIKKLVSNPIAATTPAFADEVERSFDWIPTEQEDIQAIGFYAWIKARMTGRTYHETLMELVN